MFCICSLGALSVLAAAALSPTYAADIIILRQLPPHNVLEQPMAPNSTTVVAEPVEKSELIQSLVPNQRMLSDREFGDVMASPPPGGAGAGLHADVLGHPISGSSNDPLSSLPGQGMGSFASTLGGLGGEITNQVEGALGGAMRGISGAVGGQ
jgi:hypothetical protein